MQNVQIARIAYAADGVANRLEERWDDLSELQRNRLIEDVHALRDGGDGDGTVFDETARACLAEGDALADDFDGQAVEVRNGALAYAIQHHKGDAKPSEVTATAATFEAFLLGTVKSDG